MKLFIFIMFMEKDILQKTIWLLSLVYLKIHMLKKKPLPVVRPGSQSRRFTNVIDTVKTCYYAYKKNKNSHYSISSSKHYKIIDLAKLFSNNIKIVPTRKGERFESKLNKSIRGKKLLI